MLRKRKSAPSVQYLDYSRYKRFLREEFEYECVYCEVREPELGGTQSFCADHYRPAKKFPALETNYHNLLYACRNCNQWKGDFWPSAAQKVLGEVILSPFIHKISSHLDKNQIAWQGKTRKGRWNVSKLRLDSILRLKQRENRSNILDTIQLLTDALTAVTALRDKSTGHATTALDQKVRSLGSQLETQKSLIFGKKD